ncbi:SHOCT domain-containing protein [Cellulomonas sp. 179-A 4D5 NHS]|uniref:SHOCT domain-containing protein n=1 Tax=Cellulomonas sp. 179-A 4D5 NHS TaxID=3142378 RepID=UPI0039A04177
MILVPRQLRRSGMTGQVPYYGGRLTPAQIYSLQHPQEQVPPTLRHPPTTRSASMPPRAAEPDAVRQLRELRDQGVLTDDEFATFAARVSP